jgi:hypothetical protein
MADIAEAARLVSAISPVGVQRLHNLVDWEYSRVEQRVECLTMNT